MRKTIKTINYKPIKIIKIEIKFIYKLYKLY